VRRLGFVPSQRLINGVFTLAGALAVLLLILLVSLYLDTADRLDRSETTTAALADQLRDMGVEPDVAVNDNGAALIEGPQGERGATGMRGPVGRSCVAEYGLATCRGPAGPRGPRGVAGEDSRVPGPVGADGADGADGSDSTVPGPEGPAGPAGQDGTNGKDGRDGTDGRPGRGVESVTCTGTDAATFTFTYSDGTTETVTCAAPPATEGQP
jgi:hypothetical protein